MILVNMTLSTCEKCTASEEDKKLEQKAMMFPKYSEPKYPVYLTLMNDDEHNKLRDSVALIAAGTGYRTDKKFIEDRNKLQIKYEIIKKGLFGEKPVLTAYFFKPEEGNRYADMIEVEFDNRAFSKSDLERTLYQAFPKRIIELDDYQNDIRQGL